MSDQTRQTFQPTVRVFATLAEIYAFVWRERTEFLNLIFPAVLVLSVLQVAIGAGVVASGPGAAEGAAATLPFALLLVLNLALVTLVAVAWHRRYLIRDEHPSYAQQFRWRGRHTRFALLSIGIGVLAALMAVVPILAAAALGGGATGPLIVVAGIGIYLIAVRWMLVLPATAIDAKLTLPEAWRLGTGNSWRLLSLTLLANVPVSLASWLILALLFMMIGDGPGWPGRFVEAFVAELFSFTAAVVGVSALSSAYLTLRGGRPGVPAPLPGEGTGGGIP